MEHPIVIIGAGGFGRHVLSILRSTPDWDETRFLGFVDDGEVNRERLSRINAKHLGTTEGLRTLPASTHYVIGIGNGKVREKLDKKATEAGLYAYTVIHPDSSIASDSVIGEGSVICAGARITTNVELGRQVHINMNVTIGHDANLDSYATVYPLVALGGETTIGERTTIGAGATINPLVHTGIDSYIAAGAVVIRNVADGGLVAGVPAVEKRPKQ